MFSHLKNYTPGTFEGWLHRITVNLFLDQVRRRRGLRFEPLAEIHHIAGPAPDHNLEHRTFDADVHSTLRAALAHRTPRDRSGLVDSACSADRG